MRSRCRSKPNANQRAIGRPKPTTVTPPRHRLLNSAAHVRALPTLHNSDLSHGCKVESTKERLFCYGVRMSTDGRPTKEPWWQVPWTTLRPVGNSVIVKLTILIPAVGYLIIFNDKLVGYVDLIREISNLDKSSGLSVPPRLFQLYFGFCFVAVASAIYSMACPSIIKRYPSAIDLGAATTEAVGDYGYTIVEQEVFGEHRTPCGLLHQTVAEGHQSRSETVAASCVTLNIFTGHWKAFP